jgi:hypothetical protein
LAAHALDFAFALAFVFALAAAAREAATSNTSWLESPRAFSRRRRRLRSSLRIFVLSSRRCSWSARRRSHKLAARRACSPLTVASNAQATSANAACRQRTTESDGTLGQGRGRDTRSASPAMPRYKTNEATAKVIPTRARCTAPHAPSNTQSREHQRSRPNDHALTRA